MIFNSLVKYHSLFLVFYFFIGCSNRMERDKKESLVKYSYNGYHIKDDQKLIVFKDSNFKKAIIETYFKRNTRGITIKMANSLTELNLPKKKINSINEIIYFKNLKKINLDNNNIQYIPLTIVYCKKLVRLSLRRNYISNIEPLRHLKKIKYINLEDNKIKENFSTLAILHPSLKFIKLKDNSLYGNLPEFSVKLKEIDLENNVRLKGSLKKANLCEIKNVNIYKTNIKNDCN